MSVPPALRRLHPLLAAPAAVGALAAMVALAGAPEVNVFVETRLWLTPLIAGGLASAALVAASVVRRRIAAARAEGTAEAGRAATSDRHRFVLRLDHELKNPVTAMHAGLANLSAALGDADVPADATTALDSVASQTRRLARLVADLRKIAELETRPIERSPVAIAELLDEVGEAVEELPGAAERRITRSLPDAPWPVGTVPGDRDLLFLAVHNLMVNAVKFTRPGDRIDLRARDEGAHVVIEVADTGVGIPPDEIGEIWDELARGSAARGLPGMGLGLALVRGIVARHGGQVWVRSRSGHGTVIGLTVPAG